MSGKLLLIPAKSFMGDLSRIASEGDSNGGAPLLDYDPEAVTNGTRTTSDLDSHNSPLQPMINPSQSPSQLTSSMANLSIDRYPPLAPQSKTSQTPTSTSQTPSRPTIQNGDLLDFDDTEVRTLPPSIVGAASTISPKMSREDQLRACFAARIVRETASSPSLSLPLPTS